jgi:hypothetical protein
MKSATNMASQSTVSPEAFYHLFRTLSQNDRFTAAGYILDDEEIRRYLKIPNEVSLKAFSEDKNNMPAFNSPAFNSIDELHKDLLM